MIVRSRLSCDLSAMIASRIVEPRISQMYSLALSTHTLLVLRSLGGPWLACLNAAKSSQQWTSEVVEIRNQHPRVDALSWLTPFYLTKRILKQQMYITSTFSPQTMFPNHKLTLHSLNFPNILYEDVLQWLRQISWTVHVLLSSCLVNVRWRYAGG